LGQHGRVSEGNRHNAAAEAQSYHCRSAHWEEPAFSVTTHAQPPLIYDYFGFPDHTYEIKYPAPGAPVLAEEVCTLLKKNGIAVRQDQARGFDHAFLSPSS